MKRSCRSNDCSIASVDGRSWPGPEILAIILIAENQQFDSTWHEKFRCNRHGRLMAGSGSVSLTVDVRSSPNFYISDQYAKMVLYRWIIERPSTGEDGSPFIYPSEMIDYLGELVSRIASLIQSARVFSGPHCAHLRGCIEERTAALILLCLGVTAAVGV